MLVVWEDGVEEGPEGCLLREVPGGDWDDQTWISRDGRTFQRVFDPLRGAWSWSSERSVRLNQDDALEVDLFGGALRRRTRLARAIALAWIDCPRQGAHAVAREAVEAGTIAWQSAGTLPTYGVGTAGELEERECPVDAAWRPMRYTWANANGDEVERLEDDAPSPYLLHPDGWVKSLLSERATRGHRTPDGRRWAAVHAIGLANLARAVECTFRAVPPVHARLSPTASLTLGALKDQRTAADICAAHRILPSTLWTRLLLLARSAPWDDARALWNLCPGEIRTALRQNQLDEEEGVRAMLHALRDQVDAACPLRIVEEGDAYGMLRVGWALVRRERLLERLL